MRIVPGRVIDPDNTELATAVEALVFAFRWIPYGGADSYEIFVTFGLTPAQFGQRLRRAADSIEARNQLNLSRTDHDRMLSEARRMTAISWPADITREVS